MKPSNHFTVKSITKDNLPFFIGWIVMFVWLYSYFLPFGGFKFESALYNDKVADNIFLFTLIWLVSGLVFGVTMTEKRLKRFTIYAVALAILSFALLRFTSGGIVSDAILIIGSVCMGQIFSSCCYAFFMVLNNTEKFYSMLLAVAIPKILLLLKPFLNKPDQVVDGSHILIFILLLLLLVCAFFFGKSKTIHTPQNNLKPPKKAYTLMLLVFAVLVINDVAAPSIINAMQSRTEIYFVPYYCAGAAIGLIIIFVFQKILSVELYNLLNLSFAFAVLGFVSSALSLTDIRYGIVAYLFFGASYVLGFVNIYYLAGFMAKKFQSIVFYRVGISLSALFYFVAILASRFLDDFDTNYINNAIALSAFIAVVILIIFLFSTPFFIRHLSSGEWMDDTYREDITHETRIFAKLRDYHLSPREIETCQNLLEGFTLRQISAIMGISFSTVNTYCTSIYKKLNINSRTELVVLLKEYSKKIVSS